MASGDSTARFSSLSATVLATAGVAIGLGNIWRFPYMMMDYGGVAFLLVYLLIVFLVGIPALMAEWAMGRYARRGPAGAFTALRVPGANLIAALLVLTIFMACSYYGVILAQVLMSAFEYSRRVLGGDAALPYDGMQAGSGRTMIFVVITIIIACGALLLGVKRGIERVSTIVLPVFFILFIAILARVLTLPDSITQLKEYMRPGWEAFKPDTFLAALGQAFFSMGLGGTLMVTYGSYMRAQDSIPRAAIATALTDMGAAVMAGMIVVPAALVLQIGLGGGGPGLFFEVMPQVFERMPSGTLFAAIFFASVFLVAMLSLMAGFEVVVRAAEDMLGMSRRTALILTGGLQIPLAIPALSIGAYIQYSDLIWGSTMHPVGCAMAVLAFAWSLNRAHVIRAISPATELPFPGVLFFWLRFVIPITIIVILVNGWWPTIVGWLGGVG